MRGCTGEELDVSRQDMEPRIVSGRAFFAQAPTSLATFTAQQGVQPVADFDALFGDFWPADETVDEFIATVREWRREDADARN